MSLSTYTVQKVNENNITYSFVYCMLIVLSSLLMWILCALSAIFSIYIFCPSSSLMAFLAWIPYFNWGILWGTIFTIVFSHSFFVLAYYFDFSDHQCTWSTHILHCLAAVRPIFHFRSFYVHVSRNDGYARGCFLVCQLWMEPFGLDCTVSSAHSSSSRLDLLFKLLLEASIRSSPSHQVRDAAGSLGAPNARVAADVHPPHGNVLCFVLHLGPLWNSSEFV